MYEVVAEFEPRPGSSTDAAASSDNDGTAVDAMGGGPGGRRLGLNPLGPNNVLVVMMGFISNLNREIFPACDTACVLVRWWRSAPLIHPPYSRAHAPCTRPFAHAPLHTPLCTRPMHMPHALCTRPVHTPNAHSLPALPPHTPSPHSLCPLPLLTLPPPHTHSFTLPLCLPIPACQGLLWDSSPSVNSLFQDSSSGAFSLDKSTSTVVKIQLGVCVVQIATPPPPMLHPASHPCCCTLA